MAWRTPLVLIHHPPVDARWRIFRLRDGLVDAESLRGTLAGLSRGLVLYGHTHVRVRCQMPTAAGSLDVIGASGGALDHPDDAVRAGFNEYRFDANGDVLSVNSYVVDPTDLSLYSTSIPTRRSCL